MAHYVSHQAAGEIPFVPSVHVELHLRCKRQRITLSDVVGWYQLVGDFGVEQREGTANAQSWQSLRKPSDVAFQTHYLGVCCVVREEQVHDAGIKDGCLQSVDLNKERATVEAKGAPGHVGFPSKLIVRDVIGRQLKWHFVSSGALRTPRAVQQTGPESFRVCGIPQDIVRWLIGQRELPDSA